MNDRNLVVISGRLGKDPVKRMTKAGRAITTIEIASNESVKNHETNEYEKKVSWINVVTFGHIAEQVAEDYKKGDKFIVTNGKITVNKFVDKAGFNRISYDVICNEYFDYKDIKTSKSLPSSLISDKNDFYEEDDIEDTIPF